jgi:hypothetical protein
MRRVVHPWIRVSPQNFVLLNQSLLLVMVFRSLLPHFQEDILHIDSWYQDNAAVVLLNLGDLSEVALVHALLNTDKLAYLVLDVPCLLGFK